MKKYTPETVVLIIMSILFCSLVIGLIDLFNSTIIRTNKISTSTFSVKESPLGVTVTNYEHYTNHTLRAAINNGLEFGYTIHCRTNGNIVILQFDR